MYTHSIDSIMKYVSQISNNLDEKLKIFVFDFEQKQYCLYKYSYNHRLLLNVSNWVTFNKFLTPSNQQKKNKKNLPLAISAQLGKLHVVSHSYFSFYLIDNHKMVHQMFI